MNEHIRVIKRAERERQAEAQVAKRLASASRIAQVPDAATTVTGWIGELRQLKQQSAEAAHRFKSLFEGTA